MFLNAIIPEAMEIWFDNGDWIEMA